MSEINDVGPTEPGSDTRLRLVDAMTTVIAEKGYGATTIGDIVAGAHVSRRTFYEHFADKEECLLVCHTILGDHMLTAITTAFTAGLSTQTQISDSVHALMRALSEKPNLTHTHFVTMQAAGPKAQHSRRDVQTRFAGVLQGLAAQVRATEPTVRVPSAMMATALVGGIGELIVQSVERGRVNKLDEIAPTVVELLSAVLRAPG